MCRRLVTIDSSRLSTGASEIANVTAAVAYALGSGAEEGQMSLRVLDQRDGRPQLSGATEISWRLSALESLSMGMSSPNFVSVATNLSTLQGFQDGVNIWISLYSQSGSVVLPRASSQTMQYYEAALADTLLAAIAYGSDVAVNTTLLGLKTAWVEDYSNSLYSETRLSFDYHESTLADQISSALRRASEAWYRQSYYVSWNSYWNGPYASPGGAVLSQGSRMYVDACGIQSGALIVDLYANGQQVTFNSNILNGSRCGLSFVAPNAQNTYYEIRARCVSCSYFSGYIYYSYSTSPDAFDFVATLNRTLYEVSGGSASLNSNMASLSFYSYDNDVWHSHLAPALQLVAGVSFDGGAYELELSERAYADMSLFVAGRFRFDDKLEG